MPVSHSPVIQESFSGLLNCLSTSSSVLSNDLSGARVRRLKEYFYLNPAFWRLADDSPSTPRWLRRRVAVDVTP
ncbi:hypothetical protein TIFTF001_029235 [Ficus carica]|uniref:Uncharacterized protein n=1 Tax=Ficus carica TaxID=3494 RepID=A0AA88DR54_FICCA|nr:hypothetical protein TIFTF001_029235 [Ficus carica]